MKSHWQPDPWFRDSAISAVLVMVGSCTGHFADPVGKECWDAWAGSLTGMGNPNSRTIISPKKLVEKAYGSSVVFNQALGCYMYGKIT